MSDRSGVRLLVTGFGPYPGVPENASGVLAASVAALARRVLAIDHAAAAVLPTDWRQAPRVLASVLAEYKPHVALHLGISPRAKGLVLETLARNRTTQIDDAAGWRPPESRLLHGAPASLRTPLRIAGLLARLAQDGVPARRSNDAGRYICNAVYYHSLNAARRSGGPGRAVLVHMPGIVGGAGAVDPDRATGEMAEHLAMPGLMHIIDHCLAERSAARRASMERTREWLWTGTAG